MRWLFAVVLMTMWCVPADAVTQGQPTAQEQWEMRVGAQEYQQLQRQGVILTSSPYYRVLTPIGERIARVANMQYFAPFHFILVRDSQPNAFAVPGGNVYVTTAMMTFAKSREELAGVLCHETSHDIHHDVYNLAVKNQRVQIYAGIADLLLGSHSLMTQQMIGLGANLESLNFSREVESAADHTGAFTCAAAGDNPWGMVWLFKRFETKPSGVPLEMLSDHPRDDHRVTDLENLMRSDPATFGRFTDDPSKATPLT